MDGALMHPEFNKNIDDGPPPNYTTPKTSGAIQDELRQEKKNNRKDKV